MYQLSSKSPCRFITRCCRALLALTLAVSTTQGQVYDPSTYTGYYPPPEPEPSYEEPMTYTAPVAEDFRKNCAACFYQVRGDTLCAALSENDCESPPEHDPEQGFICQWTGSACENIFRRSCENWIANAEPAFDWHIITGTTNSEFNLVADFPDDCTDETVFYAGHGESAMCAQYVDNLRSTITSAGNSCVSVSFDSLACSIFADPQAAIAEAENICTTAGLRCTISANQCSGVLNLGSACEEGEHSTRLEICIEDGGLTVNYPSCQVAGANCDPLHAGQTFTCADATQLLRQQTCCGQQSFAVGFDSEGNIVSIPAGMTYSWVDGDSCPAT